MKEKIKLGIIGMGRWARESHLMNLRQLPQFEVRAISSRSKENIEKALKVIEGEPLVFHDWRRLIESEEVEAVIITTPNYTHEEISTCALEAGKHVLVEKPPALTVEGCQKLIDLAKEKGRILQVGFELRYSDLFQKAKEIIARGEIGKVQFICCKEFRGPYLTSWRLKEEISGGTLLEKNIHHFDLFNWFAASNPVYVGGMGGINVHKEGDVLDHAVVGVEYSNQVKACLLMCLFSPFGNELVFEVIGDEGKIECYDTSQKIIYHSGLKPDFAEYHIKPKPGVVEHLHSGTLRELESFADCIREGKKPLADGEAGKMGVALALAGEKSIKEKRFIKIQV